MAQENKRRGWSARIFRWAAAGALAALLVPAWSHAATVPTDRGEVVAIVNGQPIAASEFYAELEHAAGAQVLQRMLWRALIRQAEKEVGPITDVEIDAHIAQVKRNFPDEAAFRQALADANLDEVSFREEVRLQLIVDRLRVQGIEITEADIAAYFDAHKEELGQPESIRARHILVETREEALAIVEALKKGADFAAIAREKSLDPGSKDAGGDLGFFGRGEMVPEFEEAAFALEPGQISDAVETEFGFHVIRVDEKRPAQPATLENSRELIRNILTQERAKTPEQVLDALRAKAVIEIKWSQYQQLAGGAGGAQ